MMKVVFLNEFKRTGKSLLIWSFIVAVIAGVGMLEYPYLEVHLGKIVEYMKTIPVALQVFFGIHKLDFSSPIGFYIFIYAWCSIAAYIHAMYTGAAIVSKDERDKVVEFIFTRPLKRGQIIDAKVLAAIFNVAVINLVSAVFFILTIVPTKSGVANIKFVLLSLLGMFITQLLLLSIGFLISSICRKYNKSVVIAILVLVVFYGIYIFFESMEITGILSILSPLSYFKAREVVLFGMNYLNLYAASMIIVISYFVGVRLYSKNDLV